MGSTDCVNCPFCYNKKDWESIRKGIVMCTNDDSEILTATQFNETDPLSRRK